MNAHKLLAYIGLSSVLLVGANSGRAETVTIPYASPGSSTFTVPPGVTKITFDLYGAQGGTGGSGDSSGAAPGLGGRATATIAVVPGQTYDLIVGGAGGTISAGYNGGGTGGGNGSGQNTFGGGGGGATEIQLLGTRVLVAGGGGGGGGHACGGAGGAGGGTNGGAGVSTGSPAPSSGGGGGGQSAAGGGGSAGFVAGAEGSSGTSGSGGTGGAGGEGYYSGGGGGAGGYYGGGGGGYGFCGSGGGGGSGFGPDGVVLDSGVQSGDGQITITYTQPNVAIEQAVGQSDPTNASPVNFTVFFDQPVTNFETGDVTIGGTATAPQLGRFAIAGGIVGVVSEIAPNDGTTYSVAVSGMIGAGSLIVTIPDGVAEDANGNTNTNSTSNDNEVFWDGIPPSVTVEQAGTQADPTNASPVVFIATFSEPVSGLENEDVVIDGTATAPSRMKTLPGGNVVEVSGIDATVTEIAPNDGTTYRIDITGMTGSGTVVASILANAAADILGNGNTASTSSDNSVTVDITGPSVTVNQAAGQADPTSDNRILFTAVFSEPVNGFTPNGVSLGGSATPNSKGVSEIAPFDHTTYLVQVFVGSNGTITAAVNAGAATDDVGNPNDASTSTDNQVIYDSTAPNVTIDQALTQEDPTADDPIHFIAVFDERVTGFETGDVTVSGTAAAATATVTEIAPNDGTTYDVAVTGMQTGETVTATIASGVATDLAGVSNSSSVSTDNEVTFDGTGPTVTVNQYSGQADPTSGNAIFFEVAFSEPVTDFAAEDVTGGGTAGGTKTYEVTPFGIGGTQYYVEVRGMTTSGTVTLSIGAGKAHDALGNGNLASTSTDNEVTYVNPAPSVTMNQASGQSDPTSASPIHFTAVFSEPVSGFTNNEASLSGSAGATSSTVTEIAPNDGTTYDVAVSGMTSSGSVTATIPTGVAVDGGNAGNTTSTSTDNTVTFNLPPVGPVNLVSNPGFESNTLAGWVRYPNSSAVTLTRLQNGAHTGSWSMKVKSTSSSTFGCDDQPNWVTPVDGAGAAYRFSLWVKSTDNTKKIKFQVIEQRTNGSQVGSTVLSNEQTLSTSWKQLTAVFVAQQAGSSLGLRVFEDPGSSSKSFQVDDVLIERIPTYTIVSSAGAGGTISPLGSQSVLSGVSQTYAIAPSAGNRITDVKVDNVSVGTPASYTFSNVTANHAIEASFGPIPTGVNLVANPSFESDLLGWGKYGSSVTLTRVLGSSVGGAQDGAYVMEVRSSSSSSFGCDDEPNSVTQAAGAGRRYEVTAWVKSLNNTGKVKIRIYEQTQGGSQVGSTQYSQEIPLTTGWVKLTGTITVQNASSALSIRVTEEPGNSNKSFLVDNVAIKLLPLATVAQANPEVLDGDPVALQFRASLAPNPSRGAAVLRFATTRTGPLRVRLYDVSGRVVKVLLDESQAAPGERSLLLGAREHGRIEPGMYFYRIEAGEGLLHGRWVILE